MPPHTADLHKPMPSANELIASARSGLSGDGLASRPIAIALAACPEDPVVREPDETMNLPDLLPALQEPRAPVIAGIINRGNSVRAPCVRQLSAQRCALPAGSQTPRSSLRSPLVLVRPTPALPDPVALLRPEPRPEPSGERAGMLDFPTQKAMTSARLHRSLPAPLQDPPPATCLASSRSCPDLLAVRPWW